jgi:hypothetical protein
MTHVDALEIRTQRMLQYQLLTLGTADLAHMFTPRLLVLFFSDSMISTETLRHRYAQPPTGDRRWQPPEIETPWSETRAAQKFGAACMQDKGYSTELPPIEISEDCLYLNVYRKQPGTKPANDMATNGQAASQVDGASQQIDGTSMSRRPVGSLANTTVLKPLLPVILFIHGGCFSNGCGSFFM